MIMIDKTVKYFHLSKQFIAFIDSLLVFTLWFPTDLNLYQQSIIASSAGTNPSQIQIITWKDGE